METAIIWDVKTGQKRTTLKGHTHLVSCATFNSSGDKIVTTSWDLTTIIWDIRREDLAPEDETNDQQDSDYLDKDTNELGCYIQ